MQTTQTSERGSKRVSLPFDKGPTQKGESFWAKHLDETCLPRVLPSGGTKAKAHSWTGFDNFNPHYSENMFTRSRDDLRLIVPMLIEIQNVEFDIFMVSVDKSLKNRVACKCILVKRSADIGHTDPDENHSPWQWTGRRYLAPAERRNLCQQAAECCP